MYRLDTMHSLTDRQTDRQTDIRQYRANSRSYRVLYDQLKINGINIFFHYVVFRSHACKQNIVRLLLMK